jgi:hypothetical protein
MIQGFQHFVQLRLHTKTNVAVSTAVVQFSPVQRGQHKNQELNHGPVLPD